VSLLSLDEASGPQPWRVHQAESPIVEVMAAGRRVLARSEDGAVRVWELDGGVREFRPSNGGKAVTALGPGGRLVAIGGEAENLLVHDVEKAAHYRLQLQAAPIRALAFSPDGRWLADGRDDGDVFLWDLTTVAGSPSAMRLQAHSGAVTRIVWAAEALCFVTCGADHNLRRWAFGQNPGDFEVAEMAGSGSSILDLAVSGKGDVVAAGTWHSETLCWLADDMFAQPVVLTGHSSSVGSVAIRNDGAWLATACPRDNFALLRPVDGLRQNLPPHKVQGAERWLEEVRFAPDGSIVSGDWGGQVRCWRNLTEEPWEMPIPGVDLNRYALEADRKPFHCGGGCYDAGRSRGGDRLRRGRYQGARSNQRHGTRIRFLHGWVVRQLDGRSCRTLAAGCQQRGRQPFRPFP
jgi:WD40 repeat protein